MSKELIKNILFILLLVIVNIITIYFTVDYSSNAFIINEIFVNISIAAGYFYSYLLAKKAEYFVNNLIIGISVYVFMAVEILVSMVFMFSALNYVTGLIVHLSVILVFFAIFAFLYSQATKANNITQKDRQENITKKAFIIEVEGQIGKRNATIDKLLEDLADEIRYMPTQSNSFVAKTDSQLNAGIKLLRDESISDEEYIETIKVVKDLVLERKKYLLLSE